MDDPDFWLKLFPEKKEAADPNIIFESRVRKQTQRYGIKKGEEASEEENELDDSFSEEETEKRKTNWTVGERFRFKTALTCFGFGRWGEIKVCD